MTPALSLITAAAALLWALPASAQTVTNVSFVNGLVLPGAAADLSGDSGVNGRNGYFSDIYYDRARNEWWGLSDRGPGGGTLPYETRVQRFTLDVNLNSGAISNFQVAQTVKFSNGTSMNGLAPSITNPAVLGNSFDPEGFVINPKNGNLLVSDEYGPSLNEFNRQGQLVKTYTVPANLVPKVGTGTHYNALAVPLVPGDPTATAGREYNRGLEGLAISPDGNFAYAMLQNGSLQDGWVGGTRGAYTRIVKFSTSTGLAVAQYAYKLESSGQGRGISALVALGNDKFLVLERNNRGVGVGATVASPDKNVYEISLAGATDVSNLNLPATGALSGGAVAVSKVAKVMDLDANTLAALGNKSPEKWEGLAIGPKLNNGQYLVLAGTDNDYSVTQNGSNVQFDVYFDFIKADPYLKSIQCPVSLTTGCLFTENGNAASLTSAYALLPAVLHAYTANVNGYLAPVPEVQTWALMLGGLVAVSALSRRRRVLPAGGRPAA